LRVSECDAINLSDYGKAASIFVSNLVVEMWKSSIGKVLFPHFFVERQVEHFIELVPIHECVGVQERVAADVSGESAKRTLEGGFSIRHTRERCFWGRRLLRKLYVPPLTALTTSIKQLFDAVAVAARSRKIVITFPFLSLRGRRRRAASFGRRRARRTPPGR
jgi:hypothetical protein